MSYLSGFAGRFFWGHLALLVLATSAGAAVIEVPGGQPTLTAAIAAAQPGDTIRITDSATYHESLSWDKPLAIEAKPGSSPLIAGDGSPYILKTLPGAEGSRVGQFTGGRIRINGDACSLPSYVIDLTHSLSLGEPVRLINLTVEVTVPIATRDDNALVKIAGPNGNLEMHEVELLGGNLGLYVWSTSANSYVTLERCRLRNRDFAVYFRGGSNTLSARGSEFESTANNTIYYSTGANGAHVYDRCWIHSKANAALIVGATRANRLAQFQRCALSVAPNQPVLGLGARSYNETWIFDHCDLLGSSGTGLVRFTDPFETTAGARTVTLTACNLINPAGPAVDTGGADREKRLTATYNNALVSSPAFGSSAQFAEHTVSNPVGPVDPLFTDPGSGNFHYDHPALNQADSIGGAIGSRLNITTVVPELIKFTNLGRPLETLPVPMQVVTQKPQGEAIAWGVVESPEMQGVIGAGMTSGESTWIDTRPFGDAHIQLHRPANGDLYIYTGNPGHFLRYRMATLTLSDLGVPETGVLYWLGQAIGPDGRFYVGTYPKASVVWVDPATDVIGTSGRLPTDARQQYVLHPKVSDEGIVYAPTGLHHKEIWAWNPTTNQKHQIAPPDVTSQTGYPALTLANDGHVYASGVGYHFRCRPTGIEVVASIPPARALPPQNESGDWQAREINPLGQLVLRHKTTAEQRTVQTDFPGLPVEIYTVATERDGRIYGGGFQPANTWSFEIATGAMRDHGRQTGGRIQVYDILNHPRGLFHSSYVGAQQDLWIPESGQRQTIANLATPHEQERAPQLILGPDGMIYTGTTPIKGLLGGALVRINPQTLQFKVWRNVIQDQSLVSLVAVPETGELFITSTINGGTSAIPTEPKAYVILWNTQTEQEVWRGEPFPGSKSYGRAARADNGIIYGHQGNRYYAFDPVARQVVHTGTLPVSTVNHLGFMNQPAGPDRLIYGLGNNAVFAINPVDHSVKVIGRHASVIGSHGIHVTENGSVYYGSGSFLWKMAPLRNVVDMGHWRVLR